MNPIITFETWEYARAFDAGMRRFAENWETSDALYYDRELMEDDRNAQPAAALCELAVAKYLNQYWHGGVWHRTEHFKHRSKADVGSNIEVRRVRTGHAVKVRLKDAGKIVWAAKIADNEYRSVELLGCISADDVIDSLRGTYQDEKYVEIDDLVKPWLNQEGNPGEPIREEVQQA